MRLYADVQYAGQNGFLPVPVSGWPLTSEGLRSVALAFAAEHERTYGYRSDEEPIQLVAVRAVATGIPSEPRVPPQLNLQLPAVSPASRRAYFGPGMGWLDTPVVGRFELGKEPVKGPVIVEEYDSTIVVPPSWQARLDEGLDLVLEVNSDP